jgi:signal transduction histidine kinase
VRAASTKSNENSIYIDGYLVDETEQKLFEEKLVFAKEKAEESDKLKSAFLNNISYEIQTPMNVIIGFSNMINNKSCSEEDREKYLDAINNNCVLLLNIIDNIVELSKIETNQKTYNFQDVTINEINDELKLWLLPIYEKKAPQLQFKIAGSFEKLSNIKFKTDKSCLINIFEHLIDNAAKFTKEGFVEIGIIIDVFNLNFYVKDTGIGIDRMHLETIFDIFYKVNPYIFSGTGLGLSLTKNLLAKLGGKIWLESEINEGTTFYFSIPLK